MIKTIYLSYDGLTDPLGQSQVLPYIIGLKQKGYDVTIISFEKTSQTNREKIKSILSENLIGWIPLHIFRKGLVRTFKKQQRLQKSAEE